MALIIGSEEADSGMTKEIYDVMNTLFSPNFQTVIDDAKSEDKTKAQEALIAAQKGWKQLAYAISKGVIEHIQKNMEVNDINVSGNVTTAVEGKTLGAVPENHVHEVKLSGVATAVTFKQNNNGPGHVK